MGYYIDLEKISLDQYKEILKTMDMIPSWKILEENIDENLDKLKALNFHNLEDLLNNLKSKSKIQEVAVQSGMSLDYLNVLRRVVNGYRPKPNRFKDFPNIDSAVVEKLEAVGIKNTLHFYDKALTSEQRSDLARQTKISIEEIERLTMLTDLSRIKWVNHTFAYVLHETGFRSAKEVSEADYQNIYQRVKALNKERQIYKGHIGENDMKRLVEAAQMLEYQMSI